MRTPPLSVIATWPPANYVDPVERGPALVIVETIFLSLAWIFLALRLYVRLAILRKSWWDDWLMLAAAICTSGVTACVILAASRYGWNLHVWDIRPAQLIAGRQISIAGQTIFLFSSNLAKLSILMSYLRIAAPKSKFRYATWATITYVIAIHWIFLIVLWTQCIPAHKYWDILGMVKGRCEAEGPPLMGQISTNIAADFIVYVLPMATLARLKLPLGQRVALMTVFGFGAVVVIAACLRLYYTYQTVYNTYDVTWEGYYLWIWTAVESNLGIICGCVPALKPLVYKARTRITQYSSSNKDTQPSLPKNRSYMSGSRSKYQSGGVDLEMNGKPKPQNRNEYSNIEKTVEWEVTGSDRQMSGTDPGTTTVQSQETWLDDSDGTETPGRGFHYGSTTEITRSSFGLKR